MTIGKSCGGKSRDAMPQRWSSLLFHIQRAMGFDSHIPQTVHWQNAPDIVQIRASRKAVRCAQIAPGVTVPHYYMLLDGPTEAASRDAMQKDRDPASRRNHGTAFTCRRVLIAAVRGDILPARPLLTRILQKRACRRKGGLYRNSRAELYQSAGLSSPA